MTSPTIAPWAADTAVAAIRLTGRGRAILGALLAVVAVIAAAGLLLGAGSRPGVVAADAAAADSAAAGLDGAALAALGLARAHVVAQGDTLWDLAVALDPAADPRPMVDRIQQLNGLQGSQLAIGQRLWVPVAPGQG